MEKNIQRIDTLVSAGNLPGEDLAALLTEATPESDGYLFAQARKVKYTAKQCICADSLNLRIIVKMIVIIVGSDAVLHMRTVTG